MLIYVDLSIHTIYIYKNVQVFELACFILVDL